MQPTRRSACLALLLALAATPLAVDAAKMLPGAVWKIRASNAEEPVAWEKPWFCHELDCPPFKLVKNMTDLELELREYPAGKWVSTMVNSTIYEKAVASGFWRLFKYISGENEGQVKVAMTAPVTVKITAGQGPECDNTFEVSFYIPEEHQASPPVPTHELVEIRTAKKARYYVAGFGGWATGAMYTDKAAEIIKLLRAAQLDFEEGWWMTAGYDSPFRLTGRHNEVWIPAPMAPALEEGVDTIVS